MVLGLSNDVSITNETEIHETGYSYQNGIKRTGQIIINLGHFKLNIRSPYKCCKKAKTSANNKIQLCVIKILEMTMKEEPNMKALWATTIGIYF